VIELESRRKARLAFRLALATDRKAVTEHYSWLYAKYQSLQYLDALYAKGVRHAYLDSRAR
jgi:hypothetical protein